MQVAIPEQPSKPWPIIRDDLTLYPAPADQAGAPMWTVHDPARNAYFLIDWLTFEVISRVALSDAGAIAESINQSTILQVDVEAVAEVLEFLAANELLVCQGDQDIGSLERRALARRHGWFQSLIHGYLFFRIPLFKPDAFLNWLAPRLDFLFSRRFLQLTGLVLLLGLWQVYRQWSQFSHALIDTFSLQGLLAYMGALIFVKTLHEFGHALMAKRCGCRVPAMGVAFLVMWPMAYTDVTESWKLDSHRRRLMIAGAGIVTELMIASWAIWLWSMLPDGGARNACLFLGTTSIVATLAINASPFMRFDGYFLLCDFLGTPNLHGRAFDYARWWLRERLFNFGDLAPESLSKEKARFFLIFAVVTWLYRLVLFAGIALMVYHYFFKVLGVALFIVEIWYFIMQPVVRELALWRNRLNEIGKGFFKHRPVSYIGLGLLLLLVVPFDITVNAQGMLKPAQTLSVIAPSSAQLKRLPPTMGATVAAGSRLIDLESPELDKQIAIVKARVDAYTKQLNGAGFDPQLRNQLPVLEARLETAEKDLQGLEQVRDRLSLAAPFNGQVVDVDPDLFVDEWVPKGAHLLTFADRKSLVVDCYVQEADLKRLDVGNWGRFIPDGIGFSTLRLKVLSVDQDATRILKEGSLASVAGGEVMVRMQDKKLVPEHAIYRVRLAVEGPQPKMLNNHLRGSVVMIGWPQSLLGEFLRGALSTLVRESDF